MIKAARNLVEKKYSYQAIAFTLDKFYQEVGSGKKD
jgi:hypothetical protein